jgi:hypothetical protein
VTDVAYTDAETRWTSIDKETVMKINKSALAAVALMSQGIHAGQAQMTNVGPATKTGYWVGRAARRLLKTVE